MTKLKIRQMKGLFASKDADGKIDIHFGLERPAIGLSVRRGPKSTRIDIYCSSAIHSQFYRQAANCGSWVDLEAMEFVDSDGPDIVEISRQMLFMDSLPSDWTEEHIIAFMENPMQHGERLLGSILADNTAAEPKTTHGTIGEFCALLGAVATHNQFDRDWGIPEAHADITNFTNGVMKDLKTDFWEFQGIQIVRRLYLTFEPAALLPLKWHGLRGFPFAEVCCRRAGNETPSAHQRMADHKRLRAFYVGRIDAGLSKHIARRELATIGIKI